MTCRLHLKPIINIFKQKSNVEKNVEKVVLKLNPRVEDDRFVIQIYCKYGITKTHKLHYESATLFQAIYSTATCRNQWVASPKVINDWLKYFHQKLDEVTIMCSATSVGLKSFTEGTPGDSDLTKRSLQTELSIDPTDFESFTIALDANLTVKLKELKAVLAFADNMNQGVTAFFDHSGQPLTFRIYSSDNYTADFVLATIDEEPDVTENAKVQETTLHPAPARVTPLQGKPIHAPNNFQHRQSNVSLPLVHSNTSRDGGLQPEVLTYPLQMKTSDVHVLHLGRKRCAYLQRVNSGHHLHFPHLEPPGDL
ncbi:hypothetical protein M427DRAFT_164165 [Gonapodya prolifera JEL478]|uniref:Rad9-domain-containing protein n=1 Tax=Gonapodya prolifera (strain JEL478) TaxID=1344416 RepID=A0A139AZB1_GONPJ|nr:hypothetical protein M427DRAFT_164165 [Gonapodya prolifera JEL478]|eukprot:KXS22092.1 hypothetical protein M427DRAFT_164165 [Gonapodya prolifera JEL478]